MGTRLLHLSPDSHISGAQHPRYEGYPCGDELGVNGVLIRQALEVHPPAVFQEHNLLLRDAIRQVSPRRATGGILGHAEWLLHDHDLTLARLKGGYFQLVRGIVCVEGLPQVSDKVSLMLARAILQLTNEGFHLVVKFSDLWERAVKQQSTIPLFNLLYCTRNYINVLLLVLNYN